MPQLEGPLGADDSWTPMYLAHSDKRRWLTWESRTIHIFGPERNETLRPNADLTKLALQHHEANKPTDVPVAGIWLFVSSGVIYCES